MLFDGSVQSFALQAPMSAYSSGHHVSPDGEVWVTRLSAIHIQGQCILLVGCETFIAMASKRQLHGEIPGRCIPGVYPHLPISISHVSRTDHGERCARFPRWVSLRIRNVANDSSEFFGFCAHRSQYCVKLDTWSTKA